MHKRKLPFSTLMKIDIIFTKKLYCFTIDTGIAKWIFLKHNTHIDACFFCSEQGLSHIWQRERIDTNPDALTSMIDFINYPILRMRAYYHCCIFQVFLFSDYTWRYYVMFLICLKIKTQKQYKKYRTDNHQWQYFVIFCSPHYLKWRWILFSKPCCVSVFESISLRDHSYIRSSKLMIGLLVTTVTISRKNVTVEISAARSSLPSLVRCFFTIAVNSAESTRGLFLCTAFVSNM